MKYIKIFFKIIIWIFYTLPYNFITKIDDLSDRLEQQLGDKTLRILHFVIFVLALVMFFCLLKYLNILYAKNEDKFFFNHGSLVSGLFILMSAILASLTVMKSIKSTERREEKNLVREHQSLEMYYVHVLDKVIQWDSSISAFTKFNVGNFESHYYEELIKRAEVLQNLLDALSEKDIFIFIKKSDYDNYEDLTHAMSENIKLIRFQNLEHKKNDLKILRLKAIEIKGILLRENNQ